MKSLFKVGKERTAMNQHTLHIGFEGNQVTVYSKVTEVIIAIKRDFQKMLEPEPKRTVGKLEVNQNDADYWILGGSKASFGYHSLCNVIERLRYEVVLCLVQSRPDLLWFHAGAAAYRGSAVLISGLSGYGKSTLVTTLCANDWTYLSDDIVPLDLNSGKVIPFLQTPWIRKNSGENLSPQSVQKLSKTEVNLKPETVCREAVPINAIIFPTFSLHAETKILPCSPATAALELLQNCQNFIIHRQEAVRHICDLVKRLPTFSLYFSNNDLAAEMLTITYNKIYFSENLNQMEKID